MTQEVATSNHHLNQGNSLFLDIDGFRAFDTLLERVWIIKYQGVKVVKVQVFRTMNGRHVILECDNSISPIEVLLFESLLGDDYRRCLCNYQKLTHGAKQFDRLYAHKNKTNSFGEKVSASEEIFSKEDSDKLLSIIELGD